jgi:hypothetical protein
MPFVPPGVRRLGSAGSGEFDQSTCGLCFKDSRLPKFRFFAGKGGLLTKAALEAHGDTFEASWKVVRLEKWR